MILRKETETCSYNEHIVRVTIYIRMNDTPQGDGNYTKFIKMVKKYQQCIIRMNDTPQGDGNFHTLFLFYHFQCYDKIRMNDTPQGDGNFLHW